MRRLRTLQHQTYDQDGGRGPDERGLALELEKQALWKEQALREENKALREENSALQEEERHFWKRQGLGGSGLRFFRGKT